MNSLFALLICTQVNLVDCANDNFEEIRSVLPMEIEITSCSNPFPFGCFNENFMEVEKALRIPLKLTHDVNGVNDNFERINDAIEGFRG